MNYILIASLFQLSFSSQTFVLEVALQFSSSYLLFSLSNVLIAFKQNVLFRKVRTRNCDLRDTARGIQFLNLKFFALSESILFTLYGPQAYANADVILQTLRCRLLSCQQGGGVNISDFLVAKQRNNTDIHVSFVHSPPPSPYSTSLKAITIVTYRSTAHSSYIAFN